MVSPIRVSFYMNNKWSIYNLKIQKLKKDLYYVLTYLPLSHSLRSESEQPAGRYHFKYLYQRTCAVDGDEVHVPGGRLRRLRLRVARREAQLGGQFGKEGYPYS